MGMIIGLPSNVLCDGTHDTALLPDGTRSVPCYLQRPANFGPIGSSRSLLVDHARILDFYLLFPFRISGYV